MSKLQDYEITERVALLKKLRKALLSQREKFRRYLEVLEHQERDILEQDTEKLQAHAELEQSIVREIYSVQKVIDPLSQMYRMAYPDRHGDIPEIEASLVNLRQRVVERNRENQELLRHHMTGIRKEISDIRAKRPRRPGYRSQPAPSLVDITT